MAGDITIPGTRRKVNKWVAGATAVGGLAAVWLLLRSRGGAAASAASGGTVTDPATGQVYPASGTDPATGQTYSAEIAQYGSVSAADAAGSGLFDQGNLYGGGYGGGYGTGTGTAPAGGSAYASNATWAQAVTAGLTDIGYSGMQVAEALGLYLTGAPLTADEARIVQAAVAEFGAPPTGTFQIIHQPGGNTGGGGGSAAAKAPAGAPSVTVGTSASDLTAAWTSVPAATRYGVMVQGPDAGTKADTTVEVTHAVFSVATSGDTGSVKVRAGNSAGWGPWSVPRTFTFANTAKPKAAPKPKTAPKTIDGKPAVKQP